MSKNKDKITQLKLFIDLDKEVKYINEMNQKGWKLVYIKGGCLYTFVKTQPDEYFTILHAERKEKISEVTTFAAQCGYESIPHTMDGFGDVLYLTAKKSEASEAFSSDLKTQVDVIKRIYKKFSVLSIIMLVIDILLILESIFFIGLYIWDGMPSELLSFAIFFPLFTVTMCFCDFFMFSATLKYKKKIKSLQNDALIYES